MDTTSATSAESLDRLRQAIDYEINPLETYTRALKSSRNTLAPISLLPPEILASTFSIFYTSAWNKEGGYLAWMCVAHVCRRWREIALNDLRLCTHIDFTK
jgi:hypothetical protein